MKAKRKKKRRNKGYQRMLNRRFFYAFVNNLMLTVCVIAIAIIWMCLKNVNMDENDLTEPESSVVESSPENNDHQVTVESSVTIETEPTETEPVEVEYPMITYSKNWNVDDEYLLAKIAMAEAEGESLETKVLVILTVLNRVHSGEFPDTINDVLFQVVGGTHQFTPIADGRWYRVEPNDECWEAVRIVQETMYDYSYGALYFESDPGENWHSRNLTLVCESDSMQFWK